MFTYNIYSRATRNNDVAVWIKHNGNKAEFSLGIELSPADLANAMSATPTPKNVRWHKYLSHLSQIINDVKVELTTSGVLGTMSAKDIRDIVKLRFFAYEEMTAKPMLLSFYDKTIGRRTNAGYRASCEYTAAKIREYLDSLGLSDIALDDLTVKWLSDFDDYLSAQGLKVNSRAIHFKNIRTVVNRAIDAELTNNYPFRRFKIKTEETRKRSLSVTELRKLFTCEVEQYQEFYRDMFKLIFCLIGINVADLHALQRITEDGRVEYKRAKTGRLYSVKVEPEAMEIITRWRGTAGLLQCADRWQAAKEFGKYTNIALKRIGEMTRSGLGGKKSIKPYWPELTTYWARHTWASIAYYLDVPKDVISHALGHSSGSDITEIYIDRDRDKVDRANRLVLDFVFYNSAERW